MIYIKINKDYTINLLKKFSKFGVWKCKVCNNIAPAIKHQKRKTYCSKSCMATDYKIILSGNNNPNYKDAALRTCINCNSTFENYQKTRKYCNHVCYQEYKRKEYLKKDPKIKKKLKSLFSVKLNKKPKPKKQGRQLVLRFPSYIPRPKPVYLMNCEYCGKDFRYSPSVKRKYCSYTCHINSGGAQRAGDAAVKAMKKYGAKKDANHHEVFDAIRLITAVHDLSSAGFGVPDGMAWVGNGWQLFDVKNPKTGYGKRGLNERQKEWASDWRGGCVYMIYNTEEALRFARGDFEGIKRFPEVDQNQSQQGN